MAVLPLQPPQPCRPIRPRSIPPTAADPYPGRYRLRRRSPAIKTNRIFRWVHICLFSRCSTVVKRLIPGSTGARGRGEETSASVVRLRVTLRRLSFQRQTTDRHDQKTTQSHQATAWVTPATFPGTFYLFLSTRITCKYIHLNHCSCGKCRASWKARHPSWLTKRFTMPFRATLSCFYAPIESFMPLRLVASRHRIFAMCSGWVSNVEFDRCPTLMVFPKRRF